MPPVFLNKGCWFLFWLSWCHQWIFPCTAYEYESKMTIKILQYFAKSVFMQSNWSYVVRRLATWRNKKHISTYISAKIYRQIHRDLDFMTTIIILSQPIHGSETLDLVILPSSVPVGKFQLSPMRSEICIISDNYHPPTQDSSELTT